MIDPIHVTLEEDSTPRARDVEIQALVRVEEIRLERTKLHHQQILTVVVLAALVATCSIVCH